MPTIFWRTFVLVWSTQAFRQLLTGLGFVAIISVAFTLLGYGVQWPMFPVFVAFFVCIGIGIDLHRSPFLRALLWAFFSGAALALTMDLVIRRIETAVGNPTQNLSAAEAIEVFAPLFAGLILAMRWCVRSEVHKAFVRGTARYGEDDLEKRRQIIEAFKERERQ